MKIREKERNELLNEWYDNYSKRLYFHIRRLVVDHGDAEDILQEFWVKVWRKMDTFREQSAPYTWLYRIATNEAMNFLRKRKRRALLLRGEQAVEHIADRLSQDTLFSGDEAERRLYAAVAALPDRQKTIFSMRYFDELKFREIAEILKLSVGAVKASYHHAEKKIRIWVFHKTKLN